MLTLRGPSSPFEPSWKSFWGCLFLLAVLAAPVSSLGFSKKLVREKPYRELCPADSPGAGTWKVDEDFPGLQDTELRLVCGDKEGSEGWKTIPQSQASFSIKSFLQQRAYLHPTFLKGKEGGKENGKNAGKEYSIVVTGPLTRVTRLEAFGTPPELKLERKRKVIGAPLTPNLLGELEKWVYIRLQGEGFACPKVTTEANSETGVIRISVKEGPRQDLVSISEESVPGLEPGVLRRFDAFRLGNPVNGDWLTLTENRINGNQIVQSTHFNLSCAADGAHATQEVVSGPPRLLTLGVGIDTEGLVQAKASWRNSRLGRMGSWVDITGLASSKEQLVNSSMYWYFLSYPSRVSLRPLVQFSHQNEEFFETLTPRGQMTVGSTWDNQWLGADGYTGPSFDEVRTIRGTGPGLSHFLSLTTRLRAQTHGFEFYSANPRAGASADLEGFFSQKDLLASTTVQRVNFKTEALWNFKNYDPPLWVFGVRAGVGLTLTDSSEALSGLPPTYLQFLGGSTTLRGFGRLALPSSGQGGLTSFFLGPELRLSNTLPYGLDPFVFVDLGEIGQESFALSGPLYYSPGFGIRWASPVGVLRTSLGHGHPMSENGGFHFYLSFGEEF
jgi:translocation and assembly module TamA